MSVIAAVVGRLLIAVMFLVSGAQKFADPSATAAMLELVGLSPNLALPTGLFEMVAGILLAFGMMTRLVSVALAVFVALTILFFHNRVTDPLQATLALKNLAIIGGLMMVFAYGQMRGSYDHMRASRRVHDAELRAARAEGKADAMAHPASRPVVTDVDGDGVAEVRPRRRWF